jgi:hypothetical protein
MQATVDISKALSVPGWMSERELLWLASHAMECTTIVEFGSFYGRSMRAMADNCPDGRLWAVDPWSGFYATNEGDNLNTVNTYVYPDFCKFLSDHIQSGRVVPHRGFSYSFKLPYQVDMVFIDGDHRYDIVHKDIDKAIELVKPGGLICGHDYGHPMWYGVKDAVNERFGEVFVEDTIWSIRR